MHEIVIPLRSVREHEPTCLNPEEVLKTIQDQYATQYLAKLGLAATPANKAAIMKEKPLDECTMHGVWAEESLLDGSRPSAMVKALRIKPKASRRHVGLDDTFLDDPELQQWYGKGSRIDVRPELTTTIDCFAAGQQLQLDMKTVTGAQGHTKLTYLGPAGKRKPAPSAALKPAGTSPGKSRSGSRSRNRPMPSMAALVSELDSARAQSNNMGMCMSACMSDGATSSEDDEKIRYLKELERLKDRFILPFAYLRGAKKQHRAGVDLQPWPSEGPLSLVVPRLFLESVLEPPRATLADVQRHCSTYVRDFLPLEPYHPNNTKEPPVTFLTGREDKLLFQRIRQLCDSEEICRLIGLLTHLLYWLMFGANRPKTERALTESAMAVMFTNAHQLWTGFEKECRGSLDGVNFILPTILLVVKHGVDRCYENQYTGLMAVPDLRQEVVDRINSLAMRLFDPDNTYSHFSHLDGTGEALQLQRRLAAQQTDGGSRAKAKRLDGLTHRSTPLVRAVLGAGSGTATCEDHRTREMIVRSDNGGLGAQAALSSPKRAQGQQELYRSAMERLAAGPGLPRSLLRSKMMKSISPKSSPKASPRPMVASGSKASSIAPTGPQQQQQQQQQLTSRAEATPSLTSQPAQSSQAAARRPASGAASVTTSRPGSQPKTPKISPRSQQQQQQQPEQQPLRAALEASAFASTGNSNSQSGSKNPASSAADIGADNHFSSFASSINNNTANNFNNTSKGSTARAAQSQASGSLTSRFASVGREVLKPGAGPVPKSARG